MAAPIAAGIGGAHGKRNANGQHGRFFGRSGWHHNEIEGIYAEAERRVQESCLDGKLSNRRYRRWVNDRLLRELAPPMDSIEIGGLFAPPPWGEKNYQTPFEQITEIGPSSPGIVAWEKFRDNVDMDYQAEVLKQLGRRRTQYQFGRNQAAMIAWRAVDRHARDALRRCSDSLLLQVLEEKLLEFLSEGKDGHNELVVEVAAPHHRLLLHGLSQFHGLVSQSKLAAATTHVHITRRTNCMAETTNYLNLYKFLQDVRHPSSQTVAAA